MAIKAIAHSYWRRIKDGARTYESVPDNVKEDILALAQSDVENCVITAEEYKDFIGEDYPSE